MDTNTNYVGMNYIIYQLVSCTIVGCQSVTDQQGLCLTIIAYTIFKLSFHLL